MQAQLSPSQFESFVASFSKPSPISIRLHPTKGKGLFENEETIPWCANGRYLNTRPSYVFDPLYHAGAYYSQEASSMIFPNAIDFSKDLKVLDLCAAPGGKSTLLQSLLTPNSLLVSNEMVSMRNAILYENMVKWGCPNTIITRNKVEDFAPLKGYFDVVLVDAPCSGEGMFRKDEDALKQWSPNLVNQCSYVQQNILSTAINLVAEGGSLVYSTCTWSAEENQNNIFWLFKNYGDILEPSGSVLPQKWNLDEFEIDNTNGQVGYFCYPDRVRGEGMFISIIKVTDAPDSKDIRSHKTIEKLSKAEELYFQKLKERMPEFTFFRFRERIYGLPSEYLKFPGLSFLNIAKCGLELGQFKGNSFIPAHESAMSDIWYEEFDRYELDKDSAIRYQQKLEFDYKDNIPKGWFRPTFQGRNLGFAKNLGNRINNYYPSDWRIRKR